MSETIPERMQVVKEETARAALEQWRRFQARVKAERAARKERRAERAEEIARHREAVAKAQADIDGQRAVVEGYDKAIGIERVNIKAMRAQLALDEKARDEAQRTLSIAYANRQAARDALKALHAEIVGRNGEEA